MAVRASDRVTLAVLPSPSYVRQYYVLQASALAPPALPTANPPVAPWTATEPTYSAGSTTTLYTTMLTAYGSVSFDYGEVQLSSTYEAAKSAYNLAYNAQVLANALDTLTNGWKVPGKTTINGGIIEADTIVAAQIGALAITAKHTITGAVFQTALSGQRVRLDSTGLKAYDANDVVKTTVGTNGILTAVNAILSGGLKTAVSGKRVVLNAATNGIEFYGNGVTQSAPPTIYGDQGTGVGDSTLSLSGGNGSLELEKYYLASGGTSGILMTGGVRLDQLYTVSGVPFVDSELSSGVGSLRLKVGTSAVYTEQRAMAGSTPAFVNSYKSSIDYPFRIEVGGGRVWLRGAISNANSKTFAVGTGIDICNLTPSYYPSDYGHYPVNTNIGSISTGTIIVKSYGAMYFVSGGAATLATDFLRISFDGISWPLHDRFS